MKNFQQKGPSYKIMHSKPVLVLLSALVVIFAWSVFGFLGKMQMTAENRRIVEQRVAELEQQKVELSGEIEKLGTEEGKEETIREKFPVAKEGEGVILVVEEENTEPAQEEEKGFFSRFLFWR